MYTHAKRQHTHVTDSVVHTCSEDYRNTKIIQHALKMSNLPNVEDGHYTGEESINTQATFPLELLSTTHSTNLAPSPAACLSVRSAVT